MRTSTGGAVDEGECEVGVVGSAGCGGGVVVASGGSIGADWGVVYAGQGGVGGSDSAQIADLKR